MPEPILTGREEARLIKEKGQEQVVVPVVKESKKEVKKDVKKEVKTPKK